MEKNSDLDVHANPVEKRTYTVEELQTILCCSRETIYSLLKRNEFRWSRIGAGRGTYRISRESFDDWLNKQM